MTPSEKDLRTSLHRGEGEPVDVDRIVAAASTARSQRRTRLASVAAAVVLVVAAGSITGVTLSRDGGGTRSADSGSGSAYSQQGRAAVRPAAPAASAASGSAASRGGSDSPACPSEFPQRLLPGGGMAGALFDRPAASITVCAYGSARQAPHPVPLTYTGNQATELQQSLENAPTTNRKTPCTAVRADGERNLAFVAVDAAGQTMRLVTTTLTVPICNTRTTNGITVRFGWVPPLGIRQQLYALTPSGLPSAPADRVPSGKNVGSPVR